MYLHYQPAPPSEMVRYLAILRRALISIARHGGRDSVHGLIFAGFLAEALHDLPVLLYHWDEDGLQPPSRLLESPSAGFPDMIERLGGTPAMVEESKTIFSPANHALELGLRDDLTDFALAPQPDLERYLDLLTTYLLEARIMRNYGSTRFAPRTTSPFATAVTNPAVAREAGKANGRAASILTDIPAALVSWSRFDEAAFRLRVGTRIAALPNEKFRWLQQGLEDRRSDSS